MTPARRSRAPGGEAQRADTANTTQDSAATISAALADDAMCGCGCGAGDSTDIDGERKAVAVDPNIKARNLARLRRIEGQVRGLQRMVEEDRYCADVMTQIASVHEALRSVGRALMRNHLKHCASSAIRSTPEAAEQMYDELVDLMYTSAR